MKKNIKSNEEWKKILTSEEFRVLREAGTERAFTGEFTDNKEDGTYTCRACKTPLFKSDTKYNSMSGWPSFWDSIDKNSVILKEDFSHNMHRIEVLCASCESHLGHLFPDGPQPTGNRYCINSISLSFEKSKK
jgi:peptide-methionine (R)-S-oxide reductase